MSFLDIATPLAALGIPAFPCAAGEKRPAAGMDDWPNKATTDVGQIARWNTDYADCNVGLVALAKPGGFCFLEFDVPRGMKAAAEETQQPVPSTRAHRSGSGFGHWIFRHTERSIALGNRQARRADGGEWFSFRADRRFVVGPGSRHPNGNLYQVVRNVEPIPVPDWLCDWIEKHSGKPNAVATHSSQTPSVRSDFDIDDFFSHYSDVLGDVNVVGNYRVPDTCPGTYSGEGTGYRHAHSTLSGFFYDEEHLGFHCFAQGCPASSWGIGDVLRHMNKFVGPYPHEIWEERVDLSLLGDVEPQDRVSAGAPLACADAVQDEESHGPQAGTSATGSKPPSALRYPELRFPYEALPSGSFKRLLDKACEGGLSPGLVCPAILTLASVVPVTDVMEGARINLYCCLLALVGAGKDTSIDRALGVLNLQKEQGVLWTPYSPSGERSVSTLLGDHAPKKKGSTSRIPGFARHCLVTYELEDTLAKARGESSSVLQMMQHLYDHNVKVFSDSRTGTQQRTDCRTSWLTALPIGDGEVDEDAFRRVFSESTTHGMLSRMLFGFSEERFDRRRSRNWTPDFPYEQYLEPALMGVDVDGEMQQHMAVRDRLAQMRVSGFAPGVEQLYESWQPEKDHSGRDTYHVLKIAVLTALLNGHDLIELSDWEFAVAFMKWQAAIRTLFTPGRASENSAYARMADRVMRTIERKTEEKIHDGVVPDECFFSWRTLSHDGKWGLNGVDVEKCVDQLVRSGLLVYDIMIEDGKEKPNKRKVRLAKQKPA